MFGFIKQTSFVLLVMLLGFGGSLSAKCVSMNNQPSMVKPTFIDYHVKLHYYPLIISLDNCNGRCSNVEDPFVEFVYPLT